MRIPRATGAAVDVAMIIAESRKKCVVTDSFGCADIGLSETCR